MMFHLRKIKDRTDLLNLVNELNCKCGVELGVANGYYSNDILRITPIKLFSIDRWSDHHGEDEYQHVIEQLKQYGDRSVIIRSTFDDALSQFDDSSLDFIYIDGYAHTAQEGGKTLSDWWPKLRDGGIFSGHDYDRQWLENTKAIDKFIATHKLQLQTTRDTQTDRFRSWFTIKQIL